LAITASGQQLAPDLRPRHRIRLRTATALFKPARLPAFSIAQAAASITFKVMSQRHPRQSAADQKRAIPFSRLAEMEYPLTRAAALANAISLMGYGLRANRADGAAALLAVADDLEDQLAFLEGAWRRIIEIGSAQRRQAGQR